MKNKIKFMKVLNEIIPEATLESTIESLFLDSIVFIKLIVKLEETFGFQFADEVLNKTYFLRIEDIFNYVEKNMSVIK